VIETLSPSPADSQPVAVNEGDASDPKTGAPPVRRWSFPPARLVALAAVAVVLGWSYAPNLRVLLATWNQDPNYSHGFLVLPVALVILYRRWSEAKEEAREKGKEAEAPAIRPSPWGWVALIAVLALRAFLYERGSDWSETATLLPVIASLTLALGGWPLLRISWPAIAFLVFLLYLPLSINDLLSQPLQRLATLGSAALLKFTGLWVLAEGNVIVVGGDELEVAAACNGLSMLMCLAATVAAMTILVTKDLWKRIVLLASIVPVALVSNILRITATAWCYKLFGAEVGGHFAHDAAGWLMMPMALVLVGLELRLLSWLVVKVEEIPPVRPDRLRPDRLRRRPV
jgi:exosortase